MNKILFILHLPPPIHGASMVGKYIHDSKVINGSFDCHYINLTTAKDITDIGRMGFRKLMHFLHLLRKIKEEVKRVKPDLVYVTPNTRGGAFIKDFFVVRMLKQLGCKVVVHYHNKGVKSGQDTMVYDRMYRSFFKGLKVILLSPCLYDDIRKYAKPENCFYCANGIPDYANIRLPRQNHVPQILFLSNLLVSKGVTVLLDALKILKEEGYRFHCMFAGAETNEISTTQFRNFVTERKIGDVVEYAGKMYGTDKANIYEKADMFVFPTFYHNECFPLVLLEAMQYHLPCISTPEGGIPGIIEDGVSGFIIQKNDPNMLAEKLKFFILNPKACQEMGEKGFEKFQKEFTLDKFEHNLCNILRICMSPVSSQKLAIN